MFNWIKTFMLMAAITALFIVIGGMIGGRSGMMLALLFALGMNFFSYWFSDKMVLRMYNAQEVTETSAPQFYRMVQELAQRAQLPMPKVYLIQEDAPNAFATGRNPENAAVAADDVAGLVRLARERQVDLTVVGPEVPLVAGIVDAFDREDSFGELFGLVEREGAIHQIESLSGDGRDFALPVDVAGFGEVEHLQHLGDDRSNDWQIDAAFVDDGHELPGVEPATDFAVANLSDR